MVFILERNACVFCFYGKINYGTAQYAFLIFIHVQNTIFIIRLRVKTATLSRVLTYLFDKGENKLITPDDLSR